MKRAVAMNSTFQHVLNELVNHSSCRSSPAAHSRQEPAISVRREAEIDRPAALPTPWHRTRVPVRMKLLRKIRPLLFRLALPVLRHLLKRNADTSVAGLHL